MLGTVTDAICTDPAGQYVDATFGRGGHSGALLARLDATARLLVLDRDPAAIVAAEALAAADTRVTVAHARMSDMANQVRAARLNRVVGIMMDLGVSSPQIDDPERGFSFRFDGPLDMRMDNSSGMSAADWLNTAPESEIAQVLREYGEERHARRIARAITSRRQEQPLRRTHELVEVVSSAQPRPDPHKHAATRVFQAVRIQINDELGELARTLDSAFGVLAPGGRLAVISFHSLEDRIVKRRFQRWVQGEPVPRRLPLKGNPPTQARWILRLQRAGAAEQRDNPRSRSAVLRVVEKHA